MAEIDVAEKHSKYMKHYHVMIVDDDPEDADFLNGALNNQMSHLTITECATGVDAIECLENLRDGALPYPDIIFLDLHLPKIDGYKTLQSLKARPEFATIPVTILTSSVLPSEEVKCREAGCVLYFQKPTNLEAYDDMVSEVLACLQTALEKS